ncbi:MAG: hypothetical protein HY078_03035 [Elusimicrobia bacterium]|nr:hypothetical protein [Elusimicrobiota bacterium]
MTAAVLLSFLAALPARAYPVTVLEAARELTPPAVGPERPAPSFRSATKEEFRRAIAANKIPLEDWAASAWSSGTDFWCLGERHDDRFRSAYARRVFTRLAMDELLLEAEPEEARALVRRVDAGEARVEHLSADIAEALRAARARNPGLAIRGVEPTRAQSHASNPAGRAEREALIASNIVQGRPGLRRAALYGALHCSKNSQSIGFERPFFRHLLGSERGARARSAAVVFAGDFKNLFSLYMKELELDGESWAIADTSRIDPASYNYLWELRVLLDNYDAVLFIAEP